MPSTESTYSTKDIAVAAYLRVKGFRLVSVKRAEYGDYCFFFGSDGQHSEAPATVAISFITSDASYFDHVKRAIKKLVFNTNSQSLTGFRGAWSTNYLPIAAYAVMHGGKLVGYRRINATRRSYEFYFDGDPMWYDKVSTEYQDSDAKMYDRMLWLLQKNPMEA